MVNKRGQGAFLRAEILAATTRLLGGATSRDAITLRAIAREAGIAAPSIYAHFTDREDILDIVVAETFTLLESVCQQAAATADSGIGRIRAIGHAYLDFAAEHRSAYRILFERSAANNGPEPHTYPIGLRAFRSLLDAFTQAAAEASSPGTDPDPDPVRAAQALWAALHGLVTVVPATPAFPWIPQHELVDHLIDALTG